MSVLDEVAEEHARHRANGGAVSAFSDDGLALRFSAEHAELRYVAAWNKWFRWNGTLWEADDTLKVIDLARDLCRDAARSSNDNGKSLASKRTVDAVASLARSDRRHASTIGQWDTDPLAAQYTGRHCRSPHR